MEMRERERYFIFDIYFNKYNLLCVCDFNVDDLCMHYQKTKKQERENFVRRKFKKFFIFKIKKI